MKPTELQIKVMESALDHAKKVFKKTGRLDVEFFEDEGDAWEFYVNEFYSMEADTAGITFDKDSLKSELPRGLERCCVRVNEKEYISLRHKILGKTEWYWPLRRLESTDPKWGGYLSKQDSIFIFFKENHTLEASVSETYLPYTLLSINEILSIIEKYY